MPETVTRNQTCRACGNAFTYERVVGRAGRPPSYCSNACRGTYRPPKRRPKPEPEAPVIIYPKRKFKAKTCENCGFDFIPTNGRGTICSDTCLAAVKVANKLAKTSGETQRTIHLAKEITILRVAVEIARARLAMGVYGSECGRDTIRDARAYALAELDCVLEAHDVLAATRSSWSKLALPRAGQFIDLAERRDMVETIAS